MKYVITYKFIGCVKKEVEAENLGEAIAKVWLNTACGELKNIDGELVDYSEIKS